MYIHPYGFLLLVSVLLLFAPSCGPGSARYGEILINIDPDGSSSDILANTRDKLSAAMPQKTFSVVPSVDEASQKFFVKKSGGMTGYEIWIDHHWEQMASCLVDKTIHWRSTSGSDSMEIDGWVLLERDRGASAKSVIAIALDGGPLFASCGFDQASMDGARCLCRRQPGIIP